MDHVFHRHCHSSLPLATRGEGIYILDQHGHRYLDASGGAAVSCLGHNHPRVIHAIKEQLDKIPYAHTSFFANQASESLADFLIQSAPEGLQRVYFVSGGSEAVESALKMARQYYLERGQDRKYFIARRQSYHGNTLGALAVGGNFWRRRQFQPLLMETHHIAPCYAYRDQAVDETTTDYGLRVANELEEMILQLGADQVLAFVAEPVVGATAGAVPPVAGYFRRIREICDHYDVLLILDEVMCGMGRTGTMFACEQEGVAPDILTIAKGLGAGYQPVGATLVSEKIFNTIRDGSGFFQHGHTYMAHATAAAAALAVQQTITEENLLENVLTMGQSLRELLEQQFSDHPHVGDIRGRGLFLGLELVLDRASKTPFDSSTGLNILIKKAAMQQGLMCYPMAGTIDGVRGHHILLAPAFIINREQLEELVEKLARSLDTAIRQAMNGHTHGQTR